MSTPPAREITQLLADWHNGDASALKELTPLIYQELRKLDVPDHPRRRTELINEAYRRLVKQDFHDQQSRMLFHRIAMELIRHTNVVVCSRPTDTHDGEQQFPIDDTATISGDKAAELVTLKDALIALAKFDERKARIVELRYFGGLSVEETAAALGLSVAAIIHETRLARAWLLREMKG